MQIIHYIDDILIQGSSEEEVQEVLQLVVDQKQKDWESNPSTIQGLSQTVKFWGIQWHCGHQSILHEAQQKILDFAVL